MKESEAKTKFCPYRMTNNNIAEPYCVTSKCLMWEVYSEWVPLDKETGNGGEWISPNHPDYTPHGDCGLKSKGLD